MCRSCIVFDPLVVTSSTIFQLLPNVVVCNQEHNEVDPQATALLGMASIEHRLIEDFADSRLSNEHQMMVDCNQLSYSTHYRHLLAQILRKDMVASWFQMVSSIPLRGPWPMETSLCSNSLWESRTCVIFVVRRLGCPLCRELIAGLIEYQEAFEDAEADLVLVSAQEAGADDILSRQFSSKFADKAAEKMCLKIFTDSTSEFHKVLGGRKADKTMALRPDVLKRTLQNAMEYGGRLDDINEKSDYLGGTLVIHPRLGVLHSSEETDDFRNMTAHDLLATVETLLETAENAFSMMQF